MPRNHFSQKGGPYFINNGLSKHTHTHEDPNHVKPDSKVFYSILVGFGMLLVIIGSAINSLR